MNPTLFLFRGVIFLALLTFLGSAFAQTAPCRSDKYVKVTIIRGGSTVCVLEQTARYWIADGTAILTQDITVDPEVPLATQGDIALENCQAGQVKVMLISGKQSFCVTKSVAERWIAEKLAVEVDDQEGLAVVSTPQIFPERLCKEDQIQVFLTNSKKTVCVPPALAQKWLSTGFATDKDPNIPLAKNPCKSSRQVQATIIRGGATVCALESTVRSWERQGIAIRTSAITVTAQTELEAEGTIPLEECEQKHVRVRLVGGTPAFCVAKSVAERWVQEGLAVEVDDEEGLTIISAPQLLPERLCKENQVKVIVANGDRTICTSRAIAQKWISRGFATEVDE